MSPRCLIVEDQALIAMSLEAYLEEAGIEITATFSSGTKALNWLVAHTPELALVDVMLEDGPCFKLARELKSRGIPFVIYSGLPPARDYPSELSEAPWLEKPAERAALTRALMQLVTSRMPARN
jgi:DNA-binding response OmpR family regulator